MEKHSKLYDARSIGEIVNRTARLLRRLADQRLAPFGASAGHLPVLTALMNGDAMSQKALTEYAGIEQPTMAATLARMERDGSIARQPDPRDKRTVLFALTASARSQAADINAAVRRLNSDALADMSQSDRERLRDMLSAIAGSVEKALEARPDQRAAASRANPGRHESAVISPLSIRPRPSPEATPRPGRRRRT